MFINLHKKFHASPTPPHPPFELIKFGLLLTTVQCIPVKTWPCAFLLFGNLKWSPIWHLMPGVNTPYYPIIYGGGLIKGFIYAHLDLKQRSNLLVCIYTSKRWPQNSQVFPAWCRGSRRSRSTRESPPPSLGTQNPRRVTPHVWGAHSACWGQVHGLKKQRSVLGKWGHEYFN